MPKIRKLKRKKRFRANVNRKRLRDKLRKLPNIECSEIKNAWEEKRSTASNLTEMGLAYDPNQVLKIPNVKNEMIKFVDEDGIESDSENIEKNIPKKVHIAQNLEEDAKHPRAKLFRLPNNEVHFATYMMDKYEDDYKAMVRDRKNYNQLTWRQIKAKIEKFKSIPEQYAEYLVQKGEIVLDDPTPLQKLKPDIMKQVVEKKPNAKLSRRKRQKSKLIPSIWQEESIDEDKLIDIESENNIVGENKSSSEAAAEKKLQLFPDDDNMDNDDEENEGDDYFEDDDDDDSDNDNTNDNNKKVNKSKPRLNLKSSKIRKQKSKKLKVR